MPRYAAILIWCNKVDVVVYQVTSTLEKMNSYLSKRFDHLSSFKIGDESYGWPGYTTGKLKVVSRYGVHLRKSPGIYERAFVAQWDAAHGKATNMCDCCHRRIVVVKVSSKLSIPEILAQVRNY